MENDDREALFKIIDAYIRDFKAKSILPVIEATRLKEMLYFFHVPVRMAYFFGAMDACSEYIIDLGTSMSLDEDTINTIAGEG